MVDRTSNTKNLAILAPTILRIGLGLVFFIGGWSKLSQLLDPSLQQGILASYWGTTGYVNQFFIDFMFGPGGIPPWWFLTSLSAFEFFSGIALIAGIYVRPLSLIYAFLLWTFIVSLPTFSVPGVEIGVKTYTAPALFVQVRDVALSGMMFVLYNLGSGAYSLDAKISPDKIKADINWPPLELLLRLSIALPLLIGGVFFGMANIPSFASSAWILLPLGLLIAGGVSLRYTGIAVALVMVWYIVHKLNMDKSLIGNLNGFKREFAFIAGGVVLSLFGTGSWYSLDNALKRFK